MEHTNTSTRAHFVFINTTVCQFRLSLEAERSMIPTTMSSTEDPAQQQNIGAT